MMIHKFLFLMTFCLLPLAVFAQPANEADETTDHSKPTIFQALCSDNEIPRIILTTDIKRIIKNKFKKDEVAGHLEMTIGDQKREWSVDVTSRGKSRRRICDMPPLKIKFSKKELKKNKIRRKFNDLKLVSYCHNQDNYEGIVLREYLTYKLYNLLTDYSFKVQLVKIEYRDSLDRVKPIDRYGFFIENTDEMAKRLNAKEKNSFALKRVGLDHYQYDVFAIFQYMISNSDWKIAALHNTKVIIDKDTKIAYPIPYDFDYSGFVNAFYAVPNPDYPQTHVRDRVYLGECKSAEELKDIRSLFLNKKNDLLSCQDCAPLTEKECKKAKKFLKCFFKIIESDKKFKRECLR